MTKSFKVDGILLPDGAVLMEGGNTRLPGGVTGLPAAAWYCEPGIADLNIDDPEGAYEFAGWHTFTVDESDSLLTRVWSGWLIGRKISRGPYKDGPGRVWSVQIIDINALFGLQIFRAGVSQRPAETDLARVAWALTQDPLLTTPIFDNGRVSAVDPRNLAPADFIRSYPVDLFTNTAGQSGKNVFAYWDHDALQISLSYEKTEEWPMATISISNDMADVDETTCFFPFLDSELDADAYSLYTGVLLDYVGGSVYGQNYPLIDILSPTEFSPVTFKRDQHILSDRIGKLDTANSYLQTYLAAAGVEKEVITLGVRLPPLYVNALNAGDRIDVKLLHLPGLEDFTTLPIIRCSKVPTPDRTDLWDVRIECSLNQKPAIAPGGDPGDVPFEGCSGNTALIQSAEAVISSAVPAHTFNGADWPAPPTVGNLLVSCWGFADGQNLMTSNAMPGWAQVDPTGNTTFIGVGGNGGHPLMFWKIADGTETTTATIDTGSVSVSPNGDGNNYLIEFSGASALNAVISGASDTASTTPGNPITPDSGVTAIIVTFMEYHTTLHGAGTPTAGTTELYEGPVIGHGNPQHWVGYRFISSTSGSGYDVNADGFTSSGVKWGAVTAAFVCEDINPPTGTHVFREVVAEGDGIATTFNTKFAYAAGSLRVFVDGLEIINGLTETDNLTGEFTLDFAPAAADGDTRAEIVTARYQGL